MKKARKLTAVLLSLVMLLALVRPTRSSPALCPTMLQQMEKPKAPCWVTSPGAVAWMVLHFLRP